MCQPKRNYNYNKQEQKMILKKTIRKLSVKLNDITSEWVVPIDIYRMIDDDYFNEASKNLEKQIEIFGSDPEIIRAQALIQCYK